jgi:glycerate 2-kinase
MKILIAPDSFKHSLPAKAVAGHLAKGIKRIFPNAEITKVPVADGGEGTVQALVDATGGKIIETKVFDPLMRPITAFFGILGDGVTAAIEMASASGIELLKDHERDPLITTTYGVGQLMKKALDMGCRKMIIGIGGSSTNDGGAGMAQALGIKLTDIHGNEIGKGGAALSDLAEIDCSGVDKRLPACEIIVAADVTNPLTGKEGASRVYAAQKGATEAEIEILENSLKHYAALIKNKTGLTVEHIPGAGAAGGLGAGLMVFAKAKIEKGFEVVTNILDLETKIKQVDLVITGEGKMDEQTRFCKTPFGVAALAKKYDKPVIAFAGMLGQQYQELFHHGFDVIFPIADKPMSQDESMQNAGKLLEDAAERMARMIKLSGL